MAPTIEPESADTIADPAVLLWEQHLRMRMTACGLSRREQEIVLLVIRGLSNRQIANRLFICEQTVKDHLYTTFSKLTIHRRSQLAATLLRLPSDASRPTFLAS